ncbi:MAG: hypothetical protein JWO36_1870 [Myxococcales bacterium]|nr:hypothetical protein [Myxococcales bacterium]
MKEILAYVLAIAGTGMIAVSVIAAIAGNVKYMFARVTLTQLLRTNPAHAMLVCRTKPGTFYEAIGTVIKALAMAKTNDLAVITATSLPTYDAAGMGISTKWKMLVGKSKLAAGMAFGGLALSLSGGGVPVLLILLAIGAGGGFLYLLWFKSEIDRSIIQARAEVLPEVDRMFAEGRYVPPPSHI